MYFILRDLMKHIKQYKGDREYGEDNVEKVIESGNA